MLAVIGYRGQLTLRDGLRGLRNSRWHLAWSSFQSKRHTPMKDLEHRLQLAVADTYEIQEELGGGGMSRVFVARENR